MLETAFRTAAACRMLLKTNTVCSERIRYSRQRISRHGCFTSCSVATVPGLVCPRVPLRVLIRYLCVSGVIGRVNQRACMPPCTPITSKPHLERSAVAACELNPTARQPCMQAAMVHTCRSLMSSCKFGGGLKQGVWCGGLSLLRWSGCAVLQHGL